MPYDEPDTPDEEDDDYPFHDEESDCTDLDAAMELLAQLPSIVVVPCDRCGGCGELVEMLHLVCPKCEGCGKTTAHAETGECRREGYRKSEDMRRRSSD